MIRNINIKFKKGTVSTIIGKNGCGKTTLLKTASSLLKPISGEVLLNGEILSNMSSKDIAKKISYQLEILKIIKELKSMGKTIIMVLHDLSNAFFYSDMVCLMEKGSIAIYDLPDTVFQSNIISEIFNNSAPFHNLFYKRKNNY
ncbi:MAG: ATP-binding cassette domain-containing protein [Clostridiales bacterium]|nr:ATP-binding cassette domain-containing protein [Clostridiales bacterium]